MLQMSELQLHSKVNAKQKYQVKISQAPSYANIFVRNYRKKAAKLSFPCKTKIKQFIQKIANRMLILESNLALILQGNVVETQKQQIQLHDGLIFHVVDIKRVNIPNLNISIKRIEPNATACSYTVSSQMQIGKFMSTIMLKQFPDTENYFLVYVGKQLSMTKTFAQQLVQQCSEILAVHRVENLKTHSTTQFKRNKNKSQKVITSEKGFSSKNRISIQKNPQFATQNEERLQNNKKYEKITMINGLNQEGKKKTQGQNQIKSDENENETPRQLFQTAKFNQPKQRIENQTSENKGHKQKQIENETSFQKCHSQNQIEQTQEIIIGNNTAFSNIEKVEYENRKIITRYGLVPNNFRKLDRNQRNEIQTPHIFIGQDSIIKIKDEQEAELFQNTTQQWNQYLKSKNNLMVENIEQASKKDYKSPKILANTLRTISSNYDDQISSSLKQSGRINALDQIDCSQSIIQKSQESLKYKISSSYHNQEPNMELARFNLTKSQSQPRADQDSKLNVNFIKKPNQIINSNATSIVETNQNQIIQIQKDQVLRSLPNLRIHDPENNQDETKKLNQKLIQKIIEGQNKNLQDHQEKDIVDSNKSWVVSSMKRTSSINQYQNQDLKKEDNIVDKQNQSAGLKNYSQVVAYKIKQKEQQAQQQKSKDLKTSMEQQLQKMIKESRESESKKNQYLSGISETSSYYQNSDPNSNKHLKSSSDMAKFPYVEFNNLKLSFTSDYHKSLQKQWEGRQLQSDHVILDSLAENQISITKTDLIRESIDSKSKPQDDIMDQVLNSGTKFSNKSSMTKKNKVEVIDNLNGQVLLADPQEGTKNYQNLENNETNSPVAQQNIDQQKPNSELRQQSTNWQDEEHVSTYWQVKNNQQNVEIDNFNKKIENYQENQKQEGQNNGNNIQGMPKRQALSDQSLLLSGSKASNRLGSQQNLLQSINQVTSKKQKQIQLKQNIKQIQQVDASIDGELESENLMSYVSGSNKKTLNASAMQQKLQDLQHEYQLYQALDNVNQSYKGIAESKRQDSASALTPYHNLRLGDAIIITNEFKQRQQNRSYGTSQIILADQIRSQIFSEFYKIQSGGIFQDLIIQNQNIQAVKENFKQVVSLKQDQENLLLDYL